MVTVGDGHYTFGDSDLAAQRLALVAEIFGPTTECFLLENTIVAPVLAVDLGCGPGYTTELLSATAEPERLIAIDSSPSFAAAAAQRLGAAAEILCADVLNLPAAVTGVDLMFARLLLTHLTHPTVAVERWLRRLSSRGVLMLEEVESIITDEPTLHAYLDLQRQMLAVNGQTLEIGSIIDAGTHAQSLTVTSRIVSTTPPTAMVAHMFAMNLATWRHEPVVASLASTDAISEIAAGLDHLCVTGGAAQPITWQMRQITVSTPHTGTGLR